MNINNLVIGEKYKWKTICELIDVPYLKGNSKVKQVKQFESLCRYKKEGVWFIIEEIYANPKPIEDKRSGREFPNSIDNLMKSAIMYKVINTEDGFYCGGINSWLLEMDIVNNGFVSLNKRYYRINYENDNEEGFLCAMEKDFISLEYSSLRSHFINALEKIKKTKLADYFITCRIGYSANKVVKWTRDLEDYELKLLYLEKSKLYKKYKIINELDLLYGNEKLGIERDISKYNEFKKELRLILNNLFKANFEYTAYKVILKNTSDIALDLIEKEFLEGYDLEFLKNSIYIKRRRSAEKRQKDAQEKYRLVDKQGTFFDITNEMYVDSLNLTVVERNKVNGLYVDLWDAIYKELVM